MVWRGKHHKFTVKIQSIFSSVNDSLNLITSNYEQPRPMKTCCSNQHNQRFDY